MKVNKDTKISQILKHNSEAIAAIVAINKHFGKLENPFLRRFFAPRVTVAMAAQVGNTTTNTILASLAAIGFEVEMEEENTTTQIIETKTNPNITMENTAIVDLDVRPILESGVDPYNAIMETLRQIKPEEALRIINTFEPVPLLNVLKTKGYTYQTERPTEGEVHTFLTKSETGVAEKVVKPLLSTPTSYEEAEQKFAGKMQEIDVRELEMPMPMVSILEAIEGLAEGEALFVHHKRLPQYLLPELEQRDFDVKSNEVDADNMKLIIFKK